MDGRRCGMQLTFVDVALDHHPHDGRFTSGNLLAQACSDFSLIFEAFLGVAVTAIDHDPGPPTSPHDVLFDCLDTLLVIIGPVFSTA